MNHNTMYAPNKFFDIVAGNVRTVDSNTVEVDHELIIKELPEDTINDDIITVDAFNRLYKLPKSSLPPTIPTIDFIASNIGAPNSLVSIDSSNKLSKSLAFTNFAGDVISPSLIKSDISEFNKLGINISPTSGSPLGILKLSNLSSPASNWGTRVHWYISDEGAGGTRPFLTINASRNYDQSITWGNYWSGTAWTSSDSLDSFKWQRNFDKMFFGVSVGPQVGGTPVIEKLPLYIKANSNIGFYIDGTQDGGLYLLSPDVSTSNIILLSHNSISKKTEIIDRINIWGQNLSVNDDVLFADVKIGIQSVLPASNTRSQLKITAEQGSLLAFPKDNLGSRIELYNNNNQYPLVSLSAFDSTDNALAFGEYGGSDFPWVKSDTSFFKWQRFGPSLYLFTNNNLDPPGSEATEKIIMKYDNTALNTVIEFHKPLKMLSVLNDNLSTQILVRSGTEIKYRDVSSLPTSGGDVVGPGLSVDNSIVRFDGITGLIIQGSNTSIDDLGNVTAVSLNTGQGNNLLYSMDQDVLSNSSVDFKNIFCDNILQSDFILETTVNAGVRVDAWQIKTQNITSDALSNVNDPLSINLKYFGDSNIPLSITAPAHDNLAINFDCHNVVGLPDNYISGSVLGNIILDKSDDLFRILVKNSILPGLGFLKSSMNSVLEVGNTFINLNQVCTFAQGIIANALTTDPEILDTVLITQNSGTNEITKRAYQSVYATAINTVIALTPLVLSVWTVVDLQYALTLANNATPILNTITIDGGVQTHLSSISYDFSYGSMDVQAITYQSAIRINGFIVTSSICDFTMRSNVNVSNISNTSIFTLNANDDISLVIRNTGGNEPITVYRMAITINKLFQ